MLLSEINETLSKSLDEYDRGLLGVPHCLAAYESRCATLIAEIGKCRAFEDAEEYFSDLCEIQSGLSKIFGGRKLDVGTKLERLTREFDRLYDPFIRRYWFERFQPGQNWPD